MQTWAGLDGLNMQGALRGGMGKARVLLALVGLLLALAPSAVHAAEIRTGGAVVVGPDEVISDDLYASGSSVEILGTVRGDVVALGNSVTVSGTVTGDLMAGATSVSVPGRVDGSIRAGAATISVDGTVGEDVVAGSRSLTIGRNSTIGRDVLIGTESTSIAGQVGRNLTGGVGNLTLAGPVAGNVQVKVNSLSVTDSAVVGGNLVYTSENEASIAPGAQLRGSVERRAPERAERPQDRISPVIGWFQTLIGMFLTGLLFVLLLPGFSRGTMETLRTSPWASLGLGVLLFLVTPLVALLLFVLGLFVGGWWIGLILLALFAIGMVLGFVAAGLFAGRQIVERVGRPDVPLLVALVIGLAVLLLVGIVPFLGPLVVILAMLFGLGALVVAAWHARRASAPAEG